MCGRFTLAKTNLDKEYNLTSDKKLIPNFNITPSMSIPVIISENGKNFLKMMDWGFNLETAKGNLQIINAKSETLLEKQTFQGLVNSKRCLIPATGFYEWKRIDAKTKFPYFIHLTDREIFGFAALFRTVLEKTTGLEKYETVIITTNANKTMSSIHSRMPCIFLKGDEEKWLNSNLKFDMAKSCLYPYPDSQMKAFTVSKRVNSPINNEDNLTDYFEYELNMN
jgi:putative SOS response-associated peptidase YedK